MVENVFVLHAYMVILSLHVVNLSHFNFILVTLGLFVILFFLHSWSLWSCCIFLNTIN